MVLCMLERWSRAQGGALARSQNQLIKQLRSTVGTRSLEPWQNETRYYVLDVKRNKQNMHIVWLLPKIVIYNQEKCTFKCKLCTSLWLK